MSALSGIFVGVSVDFITVFMLLLQKIAGCCNSTVCGCSLYCLQSVQPVAVTVAEMKHDFMQQLHQHVTLCIEHMQSLSECKSEPVTAT